MSVIVTENGFSPDRWKRGFCAPQDVDDNPASGSGANGVELEPDSDPVLLLGRFDRIGLIRITFPSHTDGRGFSLAARLRQLGYCGCLRARGPLIPDQFAIARRAGFDEVEIPDEIAARQPAAQWLQAAASAGDSYQDRLRRSA
ncbi:MAG: DUF934 domain-containing protein [Paracoccaceae bacterium]